MRPAVLLACLAACSPRGGACPTTLSPIDGAAGLRLTAGGPSREVEVARSAADALRATAGLAQKPTATLSSAAPVGAAPIASSDEPRQLAEFVAATQFATDDIAIVRMGGARRVLLGMSQHGTHVTLYLGASCPPCGGGDPGSYAQAAADYEAWGRSTTIVQRVPHGADVTVQACGATTCACGHDIP